MESKVSCRQVTGVILHILTVLYCVVQLSSLTFIVKSFVMLFYTKSILLSCYCLLCGFVLNQATDHLYLFQGKLPLLAGSKDVDQILRDIQMPDDQEIAGITEGLVEQEPVSVAAVSLNENPPETFMQELQTLDKVGS